MSESKHTPGPWIVRGQIELVGKVGQRSEEWIGDIYPNGTDEYRGNIARLQSCNHIDGINSEEAESNAALIAAAPDLLEALEMSRAQWIHSVNADACLSAIAKAKGESNE